MSGIANNPGPAAGSVSSVPASSGASQSAGAFLLERLSRKMSPGRRFVPQIDGLRFVAIAAVVAYHALLLYNFHRGLADGGSAGANSWLGFAFGAGHNGVALFFAVSGFILSLPFARQMLSGAPAVSLRDYYIRRVTRIEPPYVIQLLVTLVLCVAVLRKMPSQTRLYHNPAWFQVVAAHLGSSLFYMHGVVFGEHPFPNFVLWSLEVEVQFYLLAPLLARIFMVAGAAKRRAILMAVFAISIAMSILFDSHYRYWTSLPGNMQFFIIGFFFADLYVCGDLEKITPSGKWDVACVLGVLLAVLGDQHLPEVAVPLAICAFFVAAFRARFFSRLMQNRWLTIIGGMCYTIYMYHVYLLSAFARGTLKLHLANPALDLFLQYVLLSALILPVCAVLFALTERPFMDKAWPSKLRAALLRAVGREGAGTPVRGGLPGEQ